VIDALKQQFRGLPQGFRVSAPLVVSTVAIGFSAFVVAENVGGLFGAAFASSVDAETSDPLKALAADSEAFLAKSRMRFDGRSVYSLPSPPPPKVVVQKPTKPVEPPKDPGPPPPPATYTGPSPTSVFGDTVNFGSLRVKLGETADGIKVTGIDAPWSITVEHMRGTYTVPLFARGDDRLLKPTKVTGAASGIKGGEAGAPGLSMDRGPNATAGPSGEANPVAGPAPVSGPSPVSGPATDPNGNPTAGPVVGGAPGPIRPAGTGELPRRGGGAVPGSPANPGGEPAPASDLPSPAMDPQEVPPPDEPAPSDAGVDYVDREQLPPPRSAEQIGAMTVQQAQAALAEIDATANWQVDSHNRARLNHERQLLLQRINGTP
jgi:hypothetical protein